MTSGYLAIDLGPSRLAAGIVDGSGAVVLRDRVTTPSRNVWPALTQLVRRVLAANPTDVAPSSVGVTCPGPIHHGTGAMKPVGMPTWHDFPLRRELSGITQLPVGIDTAGRGLALAELWCGDAATRPRAEQHLAALVLGDEVDGGLVIAGRLAEGLTGNLGQFGHLIVEPEGAVCACGAVGCLTVYAGARGIEASTGRELRRTPVAIVERTAIMVGRACASLAAMLDVDDIVVGGVVPSVFGAPFFEVLDRELDQRSGLAHLRALRVRGLTGGRVGPLVAAAAVARHAEAEALAVGPAVPNPDALRITVPETSRGRPPDRPAVVVRPIERDPADASDRAGAGDTERDPAGEAGVDADRSASAGTADDRGRGPDGDTDGDTVADTDGDTDGDTGAPDLLGGNPGR